MNPLFRIVQYFPNSFHQLKKHPCVTSIRMEDISDISSRPLRSLTSTTRTLLSNLLNPIKVLPHAGRSRDWRGIASLTGISAEVETNIWSYSDKFGKVLELWMENQGGTVGELLEHLKILDRYDVYEDIIDSVRQQMQLRPDNQIAIPNKHNSCINNNVVTEGEECITYEDRPGYMHQYHAFILSADEDYEFTYEMRSRLSAQGFELCSKENLLPGYSTQYAPVAKLISERCQRVILVYSPAFLTCRDNSFLRDYSQAIGIQKNNLTMLPIIYRECELPSHLTMYTMLRYNCGVGHFWQRLTRTLDLTRLPRINGMSPAPLAPAFASQLCSQHSTQSSAHSAANIVELPATAPTEEKPYFLSVGAVPHLQKGGSAQDIQASTTSLSRSIVSLPAHTTDQLMPKKKVGKVKKMLNFVTGKGRKKEKLECGY